MSSARGNGHAPSAAASYRASYAKRLHYVALEAERRYYLRKASLVEVTAVARDRQAAARRIRRAILAIADRVAPDLAHMTNQHDIHVRLLREIVSTLQSLTAQSGPA